MILEANSAGKLKLRVYGELCGIIDEQMFLPSPKDNLHWRYFSQIYFTSSSNKLSSLSNCQFF